MERKQRERNLRLVGIHENNGENCESIIQGVLSEMNFGPVAIEVAHRTGRRGNQQPRHIIFRTVKLQDKFHILKMQREGLRDRPYFFSIDLTAQDYREKMRLQPEIERAKREGSRWQFSEAGRPFVE